MAGRHQIAFYGGSFTSMPEERQAAYLEVCRPFMTRGWVDSIRVSTRPDQVAEEQLVFLKEQGVRTVEIGIQSLSDRVLSATRRGYTAEEACAAIRRTREMGLETGAQLMVGLPGDTGAESLETVATLLTLKPDFVRIYPLLVLQKTELAERMQRGEYTPLRVDEAVSLCAGMLERFREASIPVIRIGLQEQEGMRRKGSFVLAGPYHPAFGHLVRSACFLERVLHTLPAKIPPSSCLSLRIHPHDRSLLAGDRGENLRKLRGLLGPREVRIDEDPGLPRGSVECTVA
jgi:histone acetyltransferase (RNA polymerase elongator complex component)